MRIGVVFGAILTVFLLGATALAGPHLQIWSGGSAWLLEQTEQKGETVSETKRTLIKDLSWEAVYTGLMNEKQGTIDLSCQIKLHNLSGQEFRDATVELIAGEMSSPAGPPPGEGEVQSGKGEVQHIYMPAPEEEPPPGESGGTVIYFGSGDGSGTITPEGMYHCYRLPEPVDIPQGEVFIPYMKKVTIPAQVAYRLAGNSVVILVRFLNKTGHPLPLGRVKVQEPDGTLMGEGWLDPVSEDEAVDLVLGAVPGLSGERTRTDYRNFIAKNRCLESYAITIRSTRDKPALVELLETMPGSDWEITASSLPYEVVDAAHIVFRLTVLAHGKAEVSYTVEYTP